MPASQLPPQGGAGCFLDGVSVSEKEILLYRLDRAEQYALARRNAAKKEVDRWHTTLIRLRAVEA